MGFHQPFSPLRLRRSIQGTRFGYMSIGYGDPFNKDVGKLIRSHFRKHEKEIQTLLGSKSTACKDWKLFEWDVELPWEAVGKEETAEYICDLWWETIQVIKPYVDDFFLQAEADNSPWYHLPNE